MDRATRTQALIALANWDAAKLPALFSGKDIDDPDHIQELRELVKKPETKPKVVKLNGKPTRGQWEEWGKEIRMPDREIQKSWDYYQGNGFKTGRNPIKDPKAVLRTWKRTAEEKNQTSRSCI